jgi:hypothetical protein
MIHILFEENYAFPASIGEYSPFVQKKLRFFAPIVSLGTRLTIRDAD